MILVPLFDFGAPELAAGSELLFVVRNVVVRFLISRQFEFMLGWDYVFGIGALGSTMRRCAGKMAWLAPIDGVGVKEASAADLKFLYHVQQTRLGTSNRKAALDW